MKPPLKCELLQALYWCDRRPPAIHDFKGPVEATGLRVTRMRRCVSSVVFGIREKGHGQNSLPVRYLDDTWADSNDRQVTCIVIEVTLSARVWYIDISNKFAWGTVANLRSQVSDLCLPGGVDMHWKPISTCYIMWKLTITLEGAYLPICGEICLVPKSWKHSLWSQ